MNDTKRTRDLRISRTYEGYDGVIIKNLVDIGNYGIINRIDNGESTVVIAFNSDQFKSVYNLNPTKNKDMRKSSRLDINDDQYKEMKKHFGTTNDFNVAGYLLKDGYMLDFSGKHWGGGSTGQRAVDHRDIEEVLTDENNGYDAMTRMITNGNIRLMPEVGGINLSVPPTDKQRVILGRYIDYMLSHGDGVITLDFDNENGQTVKSIIYDKELTTITNKKVMNDIDNYFRGGRQSELMQFHTSYSKKIAYSTFADEIKDWGGFNSALMNIVHRNYPKHLAQNGDIIVPIGNQLIYTDGNTENPGVSKVITFDTEYADEISEATEVIYDFEERESQIENAYKAIENYYGKEIIREATNGNFDDYRRFDRRAERGKSKSDAYHRNFMQDRIRNAQEIIRNANSPSKSIRLEADGYSEVVPGKLGFTDERIDELLSGDWYGSTNKDYAQAYIAYMSPMFEIVTLYIRASNIINKITIFNAKS